MQILEYQTFSEETINEIISSSLEESINIEFKSANALSKDNSVKKEISKDVSAFANSNGGLIFYGINEKNHIADSVSFIDGNLYTKEWLENVIISSIQPRIIDIEIFPIRFSNDIQKTIYVVKIPNSMFSPHINGDKKYYRRFNFQSVPMEEYEIRNLYLRHRESKVYPNSLVVKPVAEKQEGSYSFYIEIQVVNNGRFVSEKYKVGCNISKATIGVNISYEGIKNYTITNRFEDGIVISNNDIIPLFPNEISNALCFTLHLAKDRFYDMVQTLVFKVLTFNVTEMEETEMNLNELLLKVKEQYYE